ncbi:hypothetical protein G7K_4361-t1 [Saitoella complicata NRRL Y-17804]|uniref:Uncharacterized protein n=1 Tax=Saitoella complicata (strain BCRC 22490 / CBS 7301 / JCM 7358 / NBRC 10748 / NRRL Y-17804) TaxID=698492 RepID=A0A0E9NK61_SAICN|nr:hypothetical protein G7K_4361-t1 [Saitoella complicata NRRL Y-17804]
MSERITPSETKNSSKSTSAFIILHAHFLAGACPFFPFLSAFFSFAISLIDPKLNFPVAAALAANTASFLRWIEAVSFFARACCFTRIVFLGAMWTAATKTSRSLQLESSLSHLVLDLGMYAVFGVLLCSLAAYTKVNLTTKHSSVDKKKRREASVPFTRIPFAELSFE